MNFMQEAFECGIEEQLAGEKYLPLTWTTDKSDSYAMGREHVAAIEDNMADLRDWLRTL